MFRKYNIDIDENKLNEMFDIIDTSGDRALNF